MTPTGGRAREHLVWPQARTIATLGRDRFSSTSLVEDDQRGKFVVRVFHGLEDGFRRILPWLYRQHRRLRVTGLVVPTALVPMAESVGWVHRPARGEPLSRHAFSPQSAMICSRGLVRLLRDLHGLGLFGIELRAERLFVDRQSMPLWTGLIAAPDVWRLVTGVEEFAAQELDAQVDFAALGNVIEQIVARTTHTDEIAKLRRLASTLQSDRAGTRAQVDELQACLGEPPARVSRVFLPLAVRVGRTTLLREIEAMIARRLGSEGNQGPALIALSGKPGYGKSTVVAALARRLLDCGYRVVAARARVGDRRLLGAFEDIAADLSPPSSPVEQPPEAPLSPEADRQRRIERALEALRSSMGEQSTVMIVEDIDQLSPSALDALSYLAREVVLEASGARLTLVVTLRSSEQEETESGAAEVVAELREDGFAERLRLLPIDADDARLMLASLTPEGTGEVDRLVSAACGNPGTLDQLARLTAEARGANRNFDVEDVVRLRFDLASSREQHVMEALAILDRPSDLDLIARLLPAVERSDLFATMMILNRKRMVLPVRTMRFELADRSAGAGIRAKLDRRRLTQLHQKAAKALATGAPEEHERLANHLALAGMRSEFINVGRLAAHELELAGANRSALELYERLLAAAGRLRTDGRVHFLERCAALRGLIGDAAGATDLYRKLLAMPRDDTWADRGWQYYKALGRSLRDDEQHLAANEAFDRGLALLAPGEDLKVADLLSEKAFVSTLLGEVETARGLADMAGLLAQRLPESQQAAEIRNRVGGTLVQIGESERGVGHIEEGLRISERVGALELAARALNNLGLQLGYSGGERQRGIEHCLRSLGIWERLGDLQRIAQSSANIGALYLRGYDLEKAEPYLERGLRIARRFGRSFIVMQCMVNLAELHQMRGRLGRALEIRLRVLRLTERMGRPSDYGEQLFAMSRDYLQLGDDEQGERMALLLQDLARRQQDPRQAALAEWGMAGVARLRGQLDEARVKLDRSAQLLREIGAVEHQVMCLLDRADLELTEDPSSAEKSARIANELARQAALHSDRALALLVIAESELEGNPVLAKQMMCEAEGIARELDQPELRWRCDYVAGELALRNDDPTGASRRFAAARQILEKITESIDDPELRYRYMRERRRVAVLRRVRMLPI